jgi:hypothetical protein
MTMPDPRQNFGAPQFPPPGFTSGQPAMVLDGTQQYTEQASQSADTLVEEFGDYFGFDIRHKYVLPDNKQWLEFKVLSEGDLARYHKILKRDVVVEKQTGDARIKIDQIEERHALLQVAVTGWYMVRRTPKGYLPVTFSNGSPGSEFMKWLLEANPALVADLADAVRKENPFLLGTGTETIEAIDKQIEDLTRQRAEMVERMQGNSSSATS